MDWNSITELSLPKKLAKHAVEGGEIIFFIRCIWYWKNDWGQDSQFGFCRGMVRLSGPKCWGITRLSTLGAGAWQDCQTPDIRVWHDCHNLGVQVRESNQTSGVWVKHDSQTQDPRLWGLVPGPGALGFDVRTHSSWVWRLRGVQSSWTWRCSKTHLNWIRQV